MIEIWRRTTPHDGSTDWYPNISPMVAVVRENGHYDLLWRRTLLVKDNKEEDNEDEGVEDR